MKDPFQQFADEITLIRGQVETLRRDSLGKDEARALAAELSKAVAGMAEAARTAPGAVRSAFEVDRAEMAREASRAASQAAGRALEGLQAELVQERDRLSQAAGEARREAWRWFGGFWVWLAAMLATGALLGVLAAVWVIGRGDASAFGRYPGIYCESAGGYVIEPAGGGRYCGIWIEEPPEEAG